MLVLVIPIVVVIILIPWGLQPGLGTHQVQGPNPNLRLFDLCGGLRGHLRLKEGVIIIRRVLAVEVVVLSLGRGFVHFVLGAVVVGVLVHGVLIRTGNAATIIRGQELVHRVVRRVLVLSVRDHVAVLVLIVSIVVVVILVPWRA